ncbi:hypothetical protein EYF80_009952 [Liparis tanakae]|uniref:Uncharacterized protein n=1 Tax=Liparis tanakae TaxID=230148 RepID=A0A4Z2IPT9_9TELE|nr:hypothetical protein EYF80_009952 [Liparis tanakae]
MPTVLMKGCPGLSTPVWMARSSVYPLGPSGATYNDEAARIGPASLVFDTCALKPRGAPDASQMLDVTSPGRVASAHRRPGVDVLPVEQKTSRYRAAHERGRRSDEAPLVGAGAGEPFNWSHVKMDGRLYCFTLRAADCGLKRN